MRTIRPMDLYLLSLGIDDPTERAAVGDREVDAIAVPSPPAGFADAFQSLTLLGLGNATDAGGVQSVSLVFSQGAPPAGPTFGHAFSDFLPRVHSPIVGGSVAAPQIGWSQDAPVASAVGGFLTLSGNVSTDAGIRQYQLDVMSIKKVVTASSSAAKAANARVSQAGAQLLKDAGSDGVSLGQYRWSPDLGQLQLAARP